MLLHAILFFCITVACIILDFCLNKHRNMPRSPPRTLPLPPLPLLAFPVPLPICAFHISSIVAPSCLPCSPSYLCLSCLLDRSPAQSHPLPDERFRACPGMQPVRTTRRKAVQQPTSLHQAGAKRGAPSRTPNGESKARKACYPTGLHSAVSVVGM